MSTIKTNPLIFYDSDNSSLERNSERPLNGNDNAGCVVFISFGVPVSYGGYKFISWIYDFISSL